MALLYNLLYSIYEILEKLTAESWLSHGLQLHAVGYAKTLPYIGCK